MTTYLLDVNVLLALADPAHAHHDLCHGWFEEKGKASWATCPLTENGFIRISSHPKYPNGPGNTLSALGALRGMCCQEGHRFWPDSISFRELITGQVPFSHGAVTDLYLLALAQHNQAKLATLDRKIRIGALENSSESVELITKESE